MAKLDVLGFIIASFHGNLVVLAGITTTTNYCYYYYYYRIQALQGSFSPSFPPDSCVSSFTR